MNNQQSTLNIELGAGPPQPGEALAVCLFSDGPRVSASLGRELQGIIEGLFDAGEFSGREDDSLLLHAAGAGDGAARRLLLLGLGAEADFELRTLNHAAATAVREACAGRCQSLSFVPPPAAGPGMLRALAEGAVMGLYQNGFYQNKDEEQAVLGRLTVIAAEHDEQSRAEIERGRIVGGAVNWTRSLADEPGAALPPREFARRAAEMAKTLGLGVETLCGAEIKARGMGGLWGVGQGSDEEPALIVVRYEPEGAREEDELWAFVGKGITFDTGGISIKHGLDMYEMKTDMAGGAAVLGALSAIAQLKSRRRIVAIVPAAENMPSGRAIKPGDVVRTLAGQTIEVVDTDAEGRLVLADGIAYAKQLGARRIVDLATLTGSIIVALGDHRAGLFSNDDEWAGRVGRAGERAGEPAWPMPVSDDYEKRIESAIADFKNYGGRPDATAAALLLSRFAAGTPWVHLDIAGTAWNDEELPHAPKGSTGAGVRTLVELACGPLA
ncbi:MAG TPA: leucyl aminopeptidase [Pyrinomonadaceae bacterium]|jgi:leucyl aminopeptidase